MAADSTNERAIAGLVNFSQHRVAPVTGFSFPNAIDTFSMTHCMRRKGLSYDRQHTTTPGNCLGSMCRAQLRCRHFRLSSRTRQAPDGACRGRRRVEGLCKVYAKQRLERGLLAGIRDTSSRPGQIRGSGSQRSKWLLLGLAWRLPVSRSRRGCRPSPLPAPGREARGSYR